MLTEAVTVTFEQFAFPAVQEHVCMQEQKPKVHHTRQATMGILVCSHLYKGWCFCDGVLLESCRTHWGVGDILKSRPCMQSPLAGSGSRCVSKVLIKDNGSLAQGGERGCLASLRLGGLEVSRGLGRE